MMPGSTGTRVLLTAALATLPALSATAARAQERSGLAALAERPLLGRIERQEVDGRAVGRRVAYTAYVPPLSARGPGAELPLVVHLHGVFGTEARWVRKAVPQLLEEAARDGRVPPLLVVAPEGGGGFWTDAAERRRDWSRFVVEDLLPDVARRFPAAGGPSRRVLLGTGTGAVGALALALERPDRFLGAAAVRPLLLGPDPAAWPAPARARMRHPFLQRPFERAFGGAADGGSWRRVHPLTLLGRPAERRPRLAVAAWSGDPLLDPAVLDRLEARLGPPGAGFSVLRRKGRAAPDGPWRAWTEVLAILLGDGNAAASRSGEGR